MRATVWFTIIALLAVGWAAPAASAHESYDIGGGEYTITVGDQNEPIYTFKWTNLDLIIRDSEGGPVTLEENEEGGIAGLDAVLVGPGGEELNGTLEGQFGEEGRYEFAEGHFYTQPGRYTLELEGEVEGVNATGSYDLPGPRQSMSDFGFPHDDVPSILDLASTVEELEQAEQENQQLQQRVNDLESQVSTLENRIETLSDNQNRIKEEQNATPGLGLGASLALVAGLALLAVRRRP